MKHLIQLWWRRLFWLLLICVVLGCVWYQHRFPSWKEEVALPDGRRITVKQKRDFVETYGTRRTWLTFSLPEMGGERTWDQALYPVMIGVVNQKVYVVGRPRSGWQFLKYGFPKFTYVAFVWDGVRFNRVPFLSVPEAIRQRENVRWCFPGGSDEPVTTIAGAAEEWCRWEKSVDGVAHFPRPREVDLRIRSAEAEFMARMSGNQPTTD